MKKITALIITFLVTLPFVGYYEHHEEIGSYPVIFIKKEPTSQIIFYRIFHPNFETGLHELTDLQRQKMIDYCKYRLGIETQLKTEKEFRTCREEPDVQEHSYFQGPQEPY